MPTLVLDRDYADSIDATRDTFATPPVVNRRPIPRLSFCRGRSPRHVSAVDWAGIAQRMADALPADHPARAEFDYAADNSEIIDLQNGGSITVLAGVWADAGRR
jgi:hypothetical protein